MSFAHHFQPSIRKQLISVHPRQRCGVLYVRLNKYESTHRLHILCYSGRF
ncbi:hypothetical protein [Rubritalea tangerina]